MLKKTSESIQGNIESIHFPTESIQSGQNRFATIRQLSKIVSIKNSSIARDPSLVDYEKLSLWVVYKYTRVGS